MTVEMLKNRFISWVDAGNAWDWNKFRCIELIKVCGSAGIPSVSFLYLTRFLSFLLNISVFYWSAKQLRPKLERRQLGFDWSAPAMTVRPMASIYLLVVALVAQPLISIDKRMKPLSRIFPVIPAHLTPIISCIRRPRGKFYPLGGQSVCRSESADSGRIPSGFPADSQRIPSGFPADSRRILLPPDSPARFSAHVRTCSNGGDYFPTAGRRGAIGHLP